jgi:hypothetical protein
MNYAIGLILVVLSAGCGGRDDSETITQGMKWSIAQRELEQNSWQSTLTKSVPAVVRPGNGGQAYRYVGPKGQIVDIVTERLGDIEKIYRIFDGNGKELQAIVQRQP